MRITAHALNPEKDHIGHGGNVVYMLHQNLRAAGPIVSSRKEAVWSVFSARGRTPADGMSRQCPGSRFPRKIYMMDG